ncbi:MAG: 30S ribosomal protein S14 [Alphaproteobacteria bacterium]|jgi:small subunit ribosomal protein S14|nr:30S ribosomal protein S14 [Alphaproteobacteria bacterium]
MAKTSSVYRNLKRIAKAEKFAAKRSKLVAEIKDKNTSPEERFKKVLKLAELPRSSSRVRIKNRCENTGRSRGVYRKFKLCRNELRRMASFGEIPGLVKSSW